MKYLYDLMREIYYNSSRVKIRRSDFHICLEDHVLDRYIPFD